jgi:hypothetical protein
MNLQFKPIPVDFAIDLYTGLIGARRTKLQPALSAAVKAIGIHKVDDDLRRLVPESSVTHLASLGLRGERVFPVPVIIRQTPPLIGYYRMLLGLSQKEFGQSERLGYSPWVNAENTGKLSPQLDLALDQFCSALIIPLAQLVNAMEKFSDQDLNDLSLLTLGSTFQGGRNNIIGSKAAQGILASLREIIGPFVEFDDAQLIRFKSPSNRVFELIASSDPDISINEGTGSQAKPLLAIEVKGGKDASNAYNRAGEAEKSHITARLQGYQNRWTIIHMKGADKKKVIEKTPSSTEIFEAADILNQSGADWSKIYQQLQSLIS